jgi:hypothetical protein
MLLPTGTRIEVTVVLGYDDHRTQNARRWPPCRASLVYELCVFYLFFTAITIIN